MRAPSPKVMLGRLSFVLKLPVSDGFHADTRTMGRGIALEKQCPGDGKARYTLVWYDGKGTGCRDVMHALGSREFAEQVWAIEAGQELLRRAQE